MTATGTGAATCKAVVAAGADCTGPKANCMGLYRCRVAATGAAVADAAAGKCLMGDGGACTANTDCPTDLPCHATDNVCKAADNNGGEEEEEEDDGNNGGDDEEEDDSGEDSGDSSNGMLLTASIILASIFAF